MKNFSFCTQIYMQKGLNNCRYFEIQVSIAEISIIVTTKILRQIRT